MAAVVEVVGIVSILPFMAVVADPALIRDNEFLNSMYEAFGFASKNWFLFAMGSILLLVFLITNAFNALVAWATLRFAWGTQASVSGRLMGLYLQSPYSFFLTRNTAELSAKVLTEVTGVISGTVIAGLRLISRAMAVLFILTLLLIIDALTAVIALTALGGSYAVIFGTIRARVKKLGEDRVIANAARFKTANEALNGIKDSKLFGVGGLFLDRFIKQARLVANHEASIATLGLLPRYALASVAFGGMLLLVLLLLATNQDLDSALPVLALYAFAGYRLMPALQEIFASLSLMRYTTPALDALTVEIDHASALVAERTISSPDSERLSLRDRLELRGVGFSYPGAFERVVSGLDLTIIAGTSVGFVGGTGAGKTTIIDLILGLIEPGEGEILVDGIPITHGNRSSWYRNLGYVQQDIYLTDSTIAGNIAFGIPDDEVDSARVEEVARRAELMEFVTGLPQGFETEVGERGIRLSGGQKQRIGIARALYRNPDVLVLDEATNALDGITESRILHELEHIEGKTIITVAHRVKAVVNCDVIYLLDGGRIVASGSYEELMKANAVFRAMAGLSGDRVH
jgi:ABC-type multidrug transport system fused ATPase/permease subunit